MATVGAAGRPRAGAACLHGCGDAAELGSMSSEPEGGDEEFGSFQAAGDRPPWDEQGPWGPPPGDGWRAFADEDEDTSRGKSSTSGGSDACPGARGPVGSPATGQWWFGDGIEQQRLKESLRVQRSSPQNKASLQSIFERCFPSDSLTVSQQEVRPLEWLLSPQAENCEAKGPHMRHAALLFESLMDRKHTFDLRTKWSGSHSQRAYLSALHIDPTNAVRPEKPKALDSPIIAKRTEGRRLLVSSSAYDKELKLRKVTDTSVPVNGFSPSHHLQNFFQQWMQSSGKKKLKMAYDFNRSLIV